jgi:hypothetical protein
MNLGIKQIKGLEKVCNQEFGGLRGIGLLLIPPLIGDRMMG